MGFVGCWGRGFVGSCVGFVGSCVCGFVARFRVRGGELPESVSEGFSLSRLIYRGKVAPSFDVRSGKPENNCGIDFKGFYVDFDGFWAGRV